MSLGPCKWCGLDLSYLDPGSPGDAEAAANDYYDGSWAAWRSYTLVDSTGSTICQGAGALNESAVGIGQEPHHELAGA